MRKTARISGRFNIGSLTDFMEGCDYIVDHIKETTPF